MSAFSLAGQSLAVVGGTGLIGTNVLRAARALGDAHTAIYSVSRTRPADRDAVAGVHYVTGSVLDGDGLAQLPEVDLALYVAGATSNYLDDPLLTIRLGSEGLARFLEHTRRAKRRAIVGSARIYGPRSTSVPLDETTVTTARSPDGRNIYDATKLLSEALGAAASSEGSPVVLARLGNVYGAHSALSTRTAFIEMVEQARTHGRIRVNGPPGSIRNHVHAEDVADGLLRALVFGRPAQAYNIGSTDHLTNVELAKHIAGAIGNIDVDVANPDAVPDHMILSIAKARSDLQYVPTRAAAEYIPASVRWYLEHRL